MAAPSRQYFRHQVKRLAVGEAVLVSVATLHRSEAAAGAPKGTSAAAAAAREGLHFIACSRSVVLV